MYLFSEEGAGGRRSGIGIIAEPGENVKGGNKTKERSETLAPSDRKGERESQVNGFADAKRKRSNKEDPLDYGGGSGGEQLAVF